MPKPPSILRGKLLSRHCLLQATLTLHVLLVGVVSAQTSIWNNPGTGSWFDPGNWSLGVPTGTTDINIGNGGTAQVLGGGAAVSSFG